MQKDVLILEYQEVFDKVAVRIVYQDENILQRGIFVDNELDVFSTHFSPHFNGSLHIRGINEVFDNDCFLVSKEDAEIIKDKVKAINKKYVRWRAEYDEFYWIVNFDCTPHRTRECLLEADEEAYRLGNYFKTQEQAEEACRRVKEVLKQYQEKLLRRNK